jgi:hypothetical protein
LFEKSVKYIFKRLGLHIERNSPKKKIPDFGAQCPSLLNYVNYQFILLDVDIKLVREQHLAVGVEQDPFVKALSMCIENNFSQNTLKQSLRNYYENYQPETALDLFNLKKNDSPSLSNSKPWAAPYPWVDYSITEWSEILKEVTKQENLRNGKFLTIDEGVHTWGPVSKLKLEVEVKRFYQLLLEINNNGYIRNDKPDGDIVLDALCNENGEWRFINRGGTHRFSVLAALGKNKIKARIQSLIFRRDYKIWPNVISNLYTKKGALKLFDRFFNGENPDFAQ